VFQAGEARSENFGLLKLVGFAGILQAVVADFYVLIDLTVGSLMLN
jgi:hypothetical protein